MQVLANMQMLFMGHLTLHQTYPALAERNRRLVGPVVKQSTLHDHAEVFLLCHACGQRHKETRMSCEQALSRPGNGSAQ